MTRQYTIDTDASILLEDGSSGAKTADFAYPILDLGGTHTLRATLVLDLTAALAVETTTGDENYDIWLFGSTSSTFASGITPLCCINIGGITRAGADGDPDILLDEGLYSYPVQNMLGSGGPYRYLRLKALISGTTPSLNIGAAYLLVNK